MATITFDTHKFITRLKDAGLPEVQAAAIADVFRDAQGEAEVATKQDLKELEVKLTAHIDTKLADNRAEIIKWVAGMLVAQAAVIAALVKLMG